MEHIRKSFEADEKKLNGNTGTLLHERRKEAIGIVEKMGIPDRKNEEYKFTDLSKVYRKFQEIEPGKESTSSPVSPGIEGLTANLVVFVNGKYDAEQSQILDKNFTIRPLAEALKEDANASKMYGSCARTDSDSFIALNTAFNRSGIYIHLPKNAVLEFPVIIHHHTDAREPQLNYTRHLIHAEMGSQAMFIEKFDSTGSEEHLLNGVSEIYVSSNASLEWFKIQNDSNSAYMIDNLQVYQERDSKFSCTTLSLEGATIRNNVYLALDGENCESHLYGLYAIDGKSHVDNHTAVDHLKPHSFSNELYKGILDDQAGGVFNGKVFVRQDAQKTNAFQSNKNILLSDQATVNTKPQLEIWADDVKCSHGCTTGQLDDEALFYLRTRGLSEKASRALLLYAFALETLEHIENDVLRDYLEGIVRKKLDYHFE